MGDEGEAVVQEVGSFFFGLALARQINGLLAQVTVELNHVATKNAHWMSVLIISYLV